MSAMPLSDTNSKSKRYFCWQRSPAYNLKVTRAWVVVGFLNVLLNTPRRRRLAPLIGDSSTNEFRFTS
jgi:hypothetical protein